MQNSIKKLEQNLRQSAEVNYVFFRFFILMIIFTKFYQLFTFTPPPPSGHSTQTLHHPRKTFPPKIFVWTPYNVLYSYDNTKASTRSLKSAYHFVLTILYYLNPHFPSLSHPTTQKTLQPKICFYSLDYSISWRKEKSFQSFIKEVNYFHLTNLFYLSIKYTLNVSTVEGQQVYYLWTWVRLDWEIG